MEFNLATARELGSFGLLVVIVLAGLRWLPRMVIAAEGTRVAVERLEEKIEALLRDLA